MMKVRFWGVRGSIPCPGPLTQKYGGNSACIELRVGENERLVIIDAGSGIRQLGNYLMQQHDLLAGRSALISSSRIPIGTISWDFPFSGQSTSLAPGYGSTVR
jgi:hypothetical protein